MTRSRLLIAVVLGSLVAGVLVWLHDDDEPDRDAATAGDRDDDAVATGVGHYTSARRPSTPRAPDGSVTISGAVIDQYTHQPVGGVEVVFRSAAGEETTMAAADGTYAVVVPRGSYRAFVRDDTVLSVGRIERVRLPGLPSADNAGAPDEAVMPIVDAQRDTLGVDLAVVRGGVISGKVVDRQGRPIKNAVLRARSDDGTKPALGTDVAESDDTGAFELRVPAGEYALEAAHPRYAGIAEGGYVAVEPGDHVDRIVTLAAGCVIAGRVVRHDGTPAADGAIERRVDDAEQFRPAGKIQPDGTFVWTTIELEPVTLRAWPWKAPPSDARTFDCRDGARFDNVVFQLPQQNADIDGVLVDASGAPVPFAYLDLVPLDAGGISQQERTDADGKWAVFHMPVGSYQVTAYVPDHGVLAATVQSPQTNVKLALAGTGRIAGTAQMQRGSFELRLVDCTVGSVSVPIADERRLVTVTDGRFEVDNVPACELDVAASWQTRRVTGHVGVAANAVAKLDLAIGPAKAKQIHGVVKDDAGRPVAGVYVQAWLDDDEQNATTDAAGRYTIETFAGAMVTATSEGASATATVPMTGGDREELDLVLEVEPDVPDEPDFE